MREVKINNIIFCTLIALIITIIMCSCESKSSIKLYDGAKSGKWVSTEANIWFENSNELNNVNIDEYSNLHSGSLIGEINIKNKITYVYVIMGYGSEMIIVNATGYDYHVTKSTLVSGTGKVNNKSNQIVMKVETDNIFDNKYKTITFNSEPIDN